MGPSNLDDLYDHPPEIILRLGASAYRPNDGDLFGEATR